jgi:hypothetical protein
MQSLCNQSVTPKMPWLVGKVAGVMINAKIPARFSELNILLYTERLRTPRKKSRADTAVELPPNSRRIMRSLSRWRSMSISLGDLFLLLRLPQVFWLMHGLA